MSKALTLEDRHYLSMYARNMPCTLVLRLNIDHFLNTIEITSDEIEKYEVDIDKQTYKFSCNDPEYVVEYDDFPQAITQSIKNYIAMYDHEGNKDNLSLHKSFKYFNKII